MKQQKVDLDFVNFVKNKKHHETDETDNYGDALFKNSENITFNDINPNKITQKSDKNLLSEYLSKNIKIINSNKNPKKSVKTKESSSSESESESNSDDYSEEKINHNTNKKYDYDELQQTLNEMNERSNLNKQNNTLEIEENNNNNTVYIGNLPKDVEEDYIFEQMKKFGDIKSIRLVSTKKGEIKKLCYIDYETNKAMKSAVKNSIFKYKNTDYFIKKAKISYVEGVDHTGGLIDQEKYQGRLGVKKQKALINKAKEQYKRKNKNKET